MDPEQLREFEEQMRSLNELMAQQNSLMAAQIKAQQDAIKANNRSAAASNEEAEADKKQAEAGKVLTKVQEAEAKAKEETIRVQQNYERALDNSIGAVQGFANALLSSTEGVGKYGNALSSAGDAAWDIGKNFGILGKIVGGSINVLTKLGSDALQLTDSITNLRDETVKFTGALPVSASELGELAKQARYSLADMAKLQKATASVGTGLTSLGATAGQGAVKFMEVAAVSDDVRRRFGKMGISQEALTDLQAKYMKQQSLAGNSMELQRKSTEQLRKESLAYAENMTRLSALTGKSADQIQQEQEVVKSQFEEQIKIRQENAKIQELEAAGRFEEANAIKKERDNRTAMLDKLTATMGPEVAAQFGRVMRTGAFDKFSAGLAAMGVNAQDLAKQVKEAPDPNKLATETFDKYDKAVTTRAVQLGQAGQYLNDEQKKAMGLNDEYMLRSNRVFGKTEEERIAAYEADKKAREESKEALDNNIEAMRSLERETKAAYQSVLEAVNPMNMSFNGAAIASAALAAAATAATIALAKMAASKIGGTPPGGPKTPDKPAAKTPRARDPKTGRFIKAPPPKPQSWLSKMTKPLSGFASKAGAVAKGAGRFIPGVGTVLAVGGAAYGAYQGAKNAEETLGIKGREATTGEKIASGAGGALSALTFGLLSAETASKGLLSVAEKFKSATGDAKTVSSSDMAAKATQEAAKKKHEETMAAQKKSAEVTAAGTTVTKDASEAVGANIEQLEKLNETTETNSKTEQQALNKFINNLDAASNSLRNLTTAMATLAQNIGSMNLGGGGTPTTPDLGGGAGAPSGGAANVPADIGQYMAATAMLESGGDPNARAKTSSAGGMFQFLDSTWKELTKEMGKNYSLQDKFDPKKAAEVMAYFTQKQKKQLERGTGRAATNTDLYMAHFLGSGGAVKFLNAMGRNPNAIAAEMDPRAAKANRSIYYDDSGRARTLQEVYNLMSNKMDKAMVQVGSGKAPAFVQQMANASGRPMAGQTGGQALAANKLDDVLSFKSPSGELDDFKKLNPPMQQAVFNAAKEYFASTGKKFQVNSAKRDPEDQKRLYDETVRAGRPGRGPGGMLVARPGRSPHESGNAIDIQEYRDPLAVKILNKNNLHQKYGSKDPVHFELMASDGGVFDGPKSGYDVQLHGTELVAPLMKDSILMQLAQTPAKMDSIEKIFGDMSGTLSNLSSTSQIEKKFSYETSSKKEEVAKPPVNKLDRDDNKSSDPLGLGKIAKFIGNIFGFGKSDKPKVEEKLEPKTQPDELFDKISFDPEQMFAGLGSSIDLSSSIKPLDVNQMLGSLNKDTELVQSSRLTERLDPNTMLADVMQKQKDAEQKALGLATAKPEVLTPQVGAPAKETDTALEMNTRLMEMLSGKLDTMISVLESGNDVSTKILKTSRV